MAQSLLIIKLPILPEPQIAQGLGLGFGLCCSVASFISSFGKDFKVYLEVHG